MARTLWERPAPAFSYFANRSRAQCSQGLAWGERDASHKPRVLPAACAAKPTSGRQRHLAPTKRAPGMCDPVLHSAALCIMLRNVQSGTAPVPFGRRRSGPRCFARKRALMPGMAASIRRIRPGCCRGNRSEPGDGFPFNFDPLHKSAPSHTKATTTKGRPRSPDPRGCDAREVLTKLSILTSLTSRQRGYISDGHNVTGGLRGRARGPAPAAEAASPCGGPGAQLGAP